jgi:hypothetical protein
MEPFVNFSLGFLGYTIFMTNPLLKLKLKLADIIKQVVKKLAFSAGYHQRIVDLEAQQKVLMAMIDKSVLVRTRNLIFENLQIVSIIGKSKIRIGSKFDGGYVVANDFESVTTVISLGIGKNLDKEKFFVNNKVKVFGYDGTIGHQSPLKHNFFVFNPRNVGIQQDQISINEIIENDIGIDSLKENSILFIDVEGSEYEILNEIKPAFLSLFRQIVIEFHDLIRETSEGGKFHPIRQKLLMNFNTYHVHANNFGASIELMSGEIIPDVLEITFINKYLFNTMNDLNKCPSAFDAPCNPNKPELIFSWNS